MTKAEAIAKARCQWGERAYALCYPNGKGRMMYEVGTETDAPIGERQSVALGLGWSWAGAFEDEIVKQARAER